MWSEDARASNDGELVAKSLSHKVRGGMGCRAPFVNVMICGFELAPVQRLGNPMS